MNDVRLKLSPPWITYVNKLSALFDADPLIAFNTDFSAEDGPTVTISVGGNSNKASAIQNLLPSEKCFGIVTLKINVVGNFTNHAFVSAKELFEAAFEKNPVFAYVITPASEYWYPNITYVVFKNCVVQFFNDNLNDCHGLISTLYEDIARDIFVGFSLENSFKYGTICFNTDVEKGNLGKPLGEWP